MEPLDLLRRHQGGARGGRRYRITCTLPGMDGEQRRLTVAEAAEALGATDGAIRKRVARGTLRSERDAEGRVWILLNAATRRDAAGQTAGQPGGQEAYRELVEELRDRVRSLEEANRENRRIIAGLIQRVPELEPASQDEPQEARQEPVEGQERAPEGQDASKTRAGHQEPAQGQERRTWWQRWFRSEEG